MSRVVYLSLAAPPTPGGANALVPRLLATTTVLAVVTGRTLRRAVAGGGRTLPGRYHFLPVKSLRGSRVPGGPEAIALLNILLALPAGLLAARIVRRHRASALVSLADGPFSLVAASIAARLARRPHVLIVFDLLEENQVARVERAFLRRAERRVFRAARTVVVLTEEMREHYRVKHGIDSTVIPVSVEAKEREEHPPPPPPFDVVFGGTVYWPHLDSLRRFASLRERIAGLRLTIVGAPENAEVLRAAGIDVDDVEPALSPDAFRRRLERAHLLLLCFGFETPHPDIVRTAAPAKLAEYMASGTPILVHAPRGSHVAEYAKAEGFAEVVDEPDPSALEAAVLRLIGDLDATARRVERARQLARDRHDASVAARSFDRVLADATA